MKLREITLLPVQFPSHTGNLVRCFVIFPTLILFFCPHIQRFRQKNIVFVCAQWQVLNCDILIQRQKFCDFRSLFFWKHGHLDAWQKIVNKFVAVIFQLRIEYIDTRSFSIICFFFTAIFAQHPADLNIFPVFAGINIICIGRSCCFDCLIRI